MGMEPELDLDNIEDELGDEFGGADEEEPLGRAEKMESVKLRKKVLEMKQLVARARSLKSAK